MIAARAAGPGRAPALVVVVSGAAVARVMVGGSAPAASVPGAIVFAALLAGGAVAAGMRPSRVSGRGVAMGIAGGAALVAVSLVGVPAVLLGTRVPAATLAAWVPLVTAVAALEELVLRGVLFDAVRARSSDTGAIALTAVLFAVIHVPLYGAAALPIDVCVGVFLGCLRVGSGGVTTPLVAHVLADLATGWVG